MFIFEDFTPLSSVLLAPPAMIPSTTALSEILTVVVPFTDAYEPPVARIDSPSYAPICASPPTLITTSPLRTIFCLATATSPALFEFIPPRIWFTSPPDMSIVTSPETPLKISAFGVFEE